VRAQHHVVSARVQQQGDREVDVGVHGQRGIGADRQAAPLGQRLHRLQAAHRRAGDDLGDRVAGELGHEPCGLAVPGVRQRTVVVGPGPRAFVAGVGVTDQVAHRASSPIRWSGGVKTTRRIAGRREEVVTSS